MSTVFTPSSAISPSTAAPDIAPGPWRGARGWMARRPVTAFLLLAFGLAYPVMALPVLADHGVIPDGWTSMFVGMDAERIASVLLVFLALLPAIVMVTWAAEGRDGLRDLKSRMFRWRIGVGWWLLVLTGLPVLTLAFAVALGDTFKPVDLVPFVATQAAGLLVNLVLINLIEETGWAGLVQTRLQRNHGLVVAAALTALPFALIHMPLHFIGDFSLGSLTTALVTLLIVCVIVRILLGGVLRGTAGSIFAVALTHTMFNRSNNEEGIVAGLVDGDGRKLAGLLAVIVLGVIAAAVSRRSARSNPVAATDRETVSLKEDS